MPNRLTVLTVLLALAPCAAPLLADDPSPVEKLAGRLAGATITIRVSQPDGEAGEPAKVTVGSGVSLGRGLIVTFSDAPANARFRVTLPDGAQAEAEVRVVDSYSRLRLLRIPQRDIAALQPVEDLPAPGASVYSAAASGIEAPAVSQGIVAAVNRRHSGAGLPPLLLCDLRTLDTSSGAAVIDKQGRLLGVVAVNAAGDGWTYAVPASHVLRLIRAQAETKVVYLRRRRPSVGALLAPGPKEGQVFVERVTPGGPAEKAGLRKGDQVLEVDGAKVRNVYQVVNFALKKQPGDRMTLVVQQQGQTKTVAVTLGGGSIIPPAKPLDIKQITVDRVEGGGVRVRALSNTREVLAPGDARSPQRTPSELVNEQVRRFGAVIESLRKDVRLAMKHWTKTAN